MHYSLVALAALVVNGCIGPTLLCRSWRHYRGTPSRYMGLINLEIEGCEKTGSASGSDSSIVMGILKKTAHMLKNTLCQGLSAETEHGVLSWGAYAEATCEEATHGKLCMVAKLTPYQDPLGYCSSLMDRCGKLASAKIINNITLGCLILSMASSILSAYIASKKKLQRTEAIGYSLLAFSLIVMALSTYYGFGDDYFSEEDAGVFGTPLEVVGNSFFLSVIAGTFSLLQALLIYLVRVPSEEAGLKGKGKHKTRHNKDEEAVALVEQAAGRATYGAAGRSGYTDAAAGDNAERQMLQHVSSAIRARGCTELPQAFSGFDTNGDGVVTLEDLEVGLRNLGVEHSPEQAQWLFRRMDTNMDGIITFEEFADHMNRFG